MTDRLDGPSPQRGAGAAPVAAALVAATLGMATCQAGFVQVIRRGASIDPSTAIRVLWVVAPFGAGALVTAGTYLAFTRVAKASRETGVRAVAPFRVSGEAPEAAAREARVDGVPRPASGAWVTLGAICGVASAIGALLGGVIGAAGGDGGPPAHVLDRVTGALNGAAEGVRLGLVLGLLLAIPAALVIGMTEQRR